MSDAIATADKEWRDYIAPIADVGAQVAEMWPEALDDEQLRQDLWWFLMSEVGGAFMTVAYANDHHPDFVPYWSQLFNNGGNLNPDGVYYMSPIDDQGVYKLAGTRGSLRIVDLQIGDGTVIAYGKVNEQLNYGPTFANYDLDYDVKVDENGWFEVILSKERPDGWDGDWWELHPKTNYILVRQFAYDAINEVDARIAIERLDTPAAKPRRTAEETKAMLDRIPEFMHSTLHTLEAPLHASFGTAAGWMNNLVKVDIAPDQAGRAGQWYIAGRFDIAEDEALILEMDPGADCRYWNLHLCNELSNTLDFYNRIIHTNGHLAEADDDGVFRVVVSHEDPGIWNWLDTMGHQKGFLWGRMDRTLDYEPKATKVKLSELSDNLPPDTRKCTPDEREAEIRTRRLGAQLRRRW